MQHPFAYQFQPRCYDPQYQALPPELERPLACDIARIVRLSMFALGLHRSAPARALKHKCLRNRRARRAAASRPRAR